MEKEENTVAGTVEEKDKAEAVATETKATDSDVDIININEEENKQKKSDNYNKQGMRKAPHKNTNDFIANQKKRKRRRLLIILLIVAAVIGLIVFWISNSVKKAKEALAGLSANTVQTAFVEKKTLYDSKDATGTLYALESRTITRSLQGSEQGGAKINAINVEVGDHVSVGDVLVEFSKENVEKSIDTWNKIPLEKSLELNKIYIGKDGEIYVLEEEQKIVKDVKNGKEYKYEGDFLQMYSNGFATIINGNKEINNPIIPK